MTQTPKSNTDTTLEIIDTAKKSTFMWDALLALFTSELNRRDAQRVEAVRDERERIFSALRRYTVKANPSEYTATFSFNQFKSLFDEVSTPPETLPTKE